MLHAEGDLLSIDLNERTYRTESIDGVLESFIGGRGVGTRLAHERIPFDADPYGPENRLYFATGPLQMSTMSFTGRMNCTGLSPLTNGLCSSNAGGFVSRNFIETGYSVVELVGRSDELIAIHVTDEDVTFEPVPELEQADVPSVSAAVEADHGLDETHLMTIGPAGENLVRFASIMTSDNRAFGRGGFGAVMGSKNVKTISFDGESPPSIDIPDVQMEVHRAAAQSDHIMKRQGTASTTDFANELEALPTRYFSERSFEHAERVNGDRVEEKKYKKGTCSQCAFACKLPTRDEDSGIETEGPEYETVMAFGPNSGVDDIVSVMKSNDLCDTLGMDTISCGDAVAAYLASEDEFGNSELIHETVEKIAYREGIGDTLAEGIDRFHDELGVENWTVKGMEFAAHDGRAFHGQALSFATSNRGADHQYGTFFTLEYPLVPSEKALPAEGLDGKPAKLVELENYRVFEDAGIFCTFSTDILEEDPSWVEELFDADRELLFERCGRVVELERHFNNQRGFDRDDDTLPYTVPGFDDALDAYYEERGWNLDGTVPEETVETILVE